MAHSHTTLVYLCQFAVKPTTNKFIEIVAYTIPLLQQLISDWRLDLFAVYLYPSVKLKRKTDSKNKKKFHWSRDFLSKILRWHSFKKSAATSHGRDLSWNARVDPVRLRGSELVTRKSTSYDFSKWPTYSHSHNICQMKRRCYHTKFAVINYRLSNKLP